MTEEGWMYRGDSEEFSANWVTLSGLGVGVSPRKLRLFLCACCRRVWNGIPQEVHRLAVEIGEKFADKLTSDEERDSALRATESRVGGGAFACRRCVWETLSVEETRSAVHAISDQSAFLSPRAEQMAQIQQEKLHQAALLREIFGHVFRPVTFDAAWRTSDVKALATGIYDERAFGRMPILADALQDAGCDNADILNHLRDESATHVRGCWALDLVLDKS